MVPTILKIGGSMVPSKKKLGAVGFQAEKTGGSMVPSILKIGGSMVPSRKKNWGHYGSKHIKNWGRYGSKQKKLGAEWFQAY